MYTVNIPKYPFLVVASGLLMSMFTAFAAPVPIYSANDIGFCPGATSMRGTAINFEGDIVGSAYTGYQTTDPNGQFYYGSGGNQHGFLYRNGKLTDLGANVVPLKINIFEQILEGGGILFDYKSGRSIRLPTEGIDLNNAGQVLLVGTGGNVSIRQPSGAVVTRLVGIQGDFGNYFYPRALNDLGQVVGRDFTVGINGVNNVVLVQPNGTYKTIAVASTTVMRPTDNYVFPLAINIRGQVVGSDLNEYWDYTSDFPGWAQYAALYDRGQNILLGNVITQAEGGVAGGGHPPDSVATDINSFGVIVGYCQGVGQHRSLLKAFVYLNGTMFDLNTLVNLTGRGLTLTEAWGINDLGQILACAADTAGNAHTLLLSPVGLARFWHSKVNSPQ